MSEDKPKRKRKIEKPNFSASVDLSALENLPPHNLEAERGVIGSLMIDPMLCDDIVPLVTADDFYFDANRRIYRHLVEMRAEGSAIDVLLLINRLQAADEFETIGGAAYLGELANSVPHTVHAEHYARIVKDKSVLRQLIHVSSGIIQGAFSSDTPTKDLLNKASLQVFELCESQTTNSISDMKTAMDAVTQYLDRKMLNQSDGIPTGFEDLDKMIDGLNPSELIILAARPSMGKTAFAMNIAEHVAVDKRKTVLVVSLEMAVQELGTRMVCSRGRLNSNLIRKGLMGDVEKERFFDVINDLSQAPMFIDDTSSRTVSEIAAIARRLKRQNDLRLVIIDYLGLIEPENSADPRQEQVAKIARRLKGLARELKIPVLCLAQLNRQTETSKDNRPKLAHLRESGAIEQDADIVMFVHREERYMNAEEAAKNNVVGKAEIIVEKHRKGETGKITLTWTGEHTRFDNYSGHDPMEDPALDTSVPGYF